MDVRKQDLLGDLSVKPASAPLLIGWKEYVDFLDWRVHRVKIKIDTGARTSALGVVTYDLKESDAGRIATIRLALHRKHPERITTVRMPVLRMVVVRNSTGMCEKRPLIETMVRVGPVEKLIRLTLTHRDGLRFPMILGRTALEGDFVVDVSKKYLLKS